MPTTLKVVEDQLEDQKTRLTEDQFTKLNSVLSLIWDSLEYFFYYKQVL